MKHEIEELLKNEICEDLENLREIEFGSDEYKTGIDSITKLIDREVELRKIEVERLDKIESRKADEEYKTKQLKDNRIEKAIGYVLKVGEIVIPVMVIVWGTKVSLKFEETGTMTTTAGRNFFGKIFSFLKR